MYRRFCKECGTGFNPRQRTALFCGVPCKQTFHNRRRERGAELYDFIMQDRHDKLIDALLAAYVMADKAMREGRPSFQDIETAMQRMPLAYGRDGDGR